MEKEIIACVKDKNIKYIHSGQISKYVFPLERKEAHEKCITHLIIRIFIAAITDDSKTLYLVQKRSKNKDSFPGYYTDSASGHVKYRKDLKLKDIKQDALRELEEEFGINPNEVKDINFYSLSTEKNKNVKEVAYIFLGFVNPDVNLIPDKEELDVSNSGFYTKEELKLILDDENSIDYSKKIWNELINMDLQKKFILTSSDKKRDNESSKVALLIGRFQPLHHGHIYIINFILKNHNKIKIGIGSSQLSHKKNDPFTSDERMAFIETALEKRDINPKRYHIYKIPDIFDAQRWVDHVISIVGNFDILYSNSDWVRELFLNKGYELGKKLGIFKKKFNGTNIRTLISKNNESWTKLVPNEVVSLIKQFNGPERIRTLYKGK
jgi:nicotinamide-nucleotide adenylyltransferase